MNTMIITTSRGHNSLSKIQIEALSIRQSWNLEPAMFSNFPKNQNILYETVQQLSIF